MLDSESREPGFKSHCGRFEPLASLITPRCHSSLSCINEYLAIQTVVDTWTNSLRALIATLLNTSQRNWNGLGMNRSAWGWSVKRFEQSQGLDTALYKNLILNEYLATDRGYLKKPYLNEKSLHSNCRVAECFPEKSRWFRNEQVCQGVKYKLLWTVPRTGYRAI